MIHANNTHKFVNCSIIVGSLRIQQSTFTGYVIILAALLSYSDLSLKFLMTDITSLIVVYDGDIGGLSWWICFSQNRMFCMHRCGLLPHMSHVSWSVCLSARHTGEPCKNGWTDRLAVWTADSCGIEEPRIRWKSTPALERILLGDMYRPTKKECHTHEECRRDAHLPFLGREPVGGWTTEVCDAWPTRRQTHGYLPIGKASPPPDRYQIILLGDRGTLVWTTCPRLLPESGTAGSRTRDLLSRKSNALTTTLPGHADPRPYRSITRWKIQRGVIWNEDEGLPHHTGLCGGGDAVCRYHYCSNLFSVLRFRDLYRRIPRMRASKLRVLESVEEITDYLWIDAKLTRLRNLDFLSNLRAIYGRHIMYVRPPLWNRF